MLYGTEGFSEKLIILILNRLSCKFDKIEVMNPKGKVEFDLEKIQAFEKISNELVADKTFEVGHADDDFINNLLTAKVSAYIYANTVDERDLVYLCERPKFTDWLFRRRKRAIFRLKVEDLLINPPKCKNTKRIYITEQS